MFDRISKTKILLSRAMKMGSGMSLVYVQLRAYSTGRYLLQQPPIQTPEPHGHLPNLSSPHKLTRRPIAHANVPCTFNALPRAPHGPPAAAMTSPRIRTSARRIGLHPFRCLSIPANALSHSAPIGNPTARDRDHMLDDGAP